MLAGGTTSTTSGSWTGQPCGDGRPAAPRRGRGGRRDRLPPGPSGDQRGHEFLGELAGRVTTGVAAICVALDPGLVVLGGGVGLAGGAALAGRVAVEVRPICPATPQVVPTGVSGGPVLRGAILAAVDRARAELLASAAGP